MVWSEELISLQFGWQGEGCKLTTLQALDTVVHQAVYRTAGACLSHLETAQVRSVLATTAVHTVANSVGAECPQLLDLYIFGGGQNSSNSISIKRMVLHQPALLPQLTSLDLTHLTRQCHTAIASAL